MIIRRWISIFKTVLPTWNQKMYRDPFDYPLRSLEEVKAELEKKPIGKEAKIELVHYKDNQQREGHVDLREMVVKIYIDMDNWNLTKKQKERLIFLLGPRYKGVPEFKIVSRQYPRQDQNLQKCLDTAYELLMEAKRAP